MAFLDYFRRAPKSGVAGQGSPVDHRRARARRHARRRPTTCRSCSRSCWRSSPATRTSISRNVTVNLDKSGGCEVLELNIVLPDGPAADSPRRADAPRARAVVARFASSPRAIAHQARRDR